MEIGFNGECKRTSSRGKVRVGVYLVFFAFVFFPYVSFFEIGADTQPYSTVFSIILFFAFRCNFSRLDLLTGLTMVIAIFLIAASGLNFNILRSVYNYVALFFVSYISFKILKSQAFDFGLILKAVIFIWLAVGFLQKFYDPSFLNFLISGARTTDNRGVVGLAPEPTFYGIVLIFFILFLLHLNTGGKIFYIGLCVFGVVFLAQSSMAVLFLLIFLFYAAITHFRVRYALMLVFLLLFGLPLLAELTAGSRLSDLLRVALSQPSVLLLDDASANDRFFHIYFSLKGFFDNYLLPGGYSDWIPYAESQIVEYSNFVIAEWFSIGGRIMSGYGSVLFELGIFGLLVVASPVYLLLRLYGGDLKKAVLYGLFVSTVMLSAIPIGFSLFAFYLGLLNYLAWVRNNSLNSRALASN